MLAATGQINLSCGVVTNHPLAENNSVSWKPVAERIGSDILVVRNAIPRIDELPELAESHADRFKPSRVVDDVTQEVKDTSHRKSDYFELSRDGCPEGLVFFGLLCRSVEPQIITAYLEHVNPHAVVQVGSGFSLLRYREGGFFGTHVDVTRDHPVLGHRRLSTILFCNDDFDGGELHFPRQGITIKPESGLLVMFPSGFTHPHESKTVAQGTKYSIVSWYF